MRFQWHTTWLFEGGIADGQTSPGGRKITPETLQITIQNLFAFRGVELKRAHRLIFGSRGSRSCSWPNFPSRNATGPGVSEAHQEIVGRIADSVHSMTELLQVLPLREVCEGDSLRFCNGRVGGRQSGPTDKGKETWADLRGVFGSKTCVLVRILVSETSHSRLDRLGDQPTNPFQINVICNGARYHFTVYLVRDADRS